MFFVPLNIDRQYLTGLPAVLTSMLNCVQHWLLSSVENDSGTDNHVPCRDKHEHAASLILDANSFCALKSAKCGITAIKIRRGECILHRKIDAMFEYVLIAILFSSILSFSLNQVHRVFPYFIVHNVITCRIRITINKVKNYKFINHIINKITIIRISD